MKIEDFNKVVKNRVDKIQTVLVEKAKEYATEDDRLHNFNEAAYHTRQTREVAIWRMAIKHYVSFQDILAGLDKGIVPSEALVNEKFGDLINYLILIEASIADKRRKYIKE